MREGLAAACTWLERNERALPGFVGAYVGGSLAALGDDALIPPGSDMDVFVALEGPPPDKRGKFLYGGLLMEISYLDFGGMAPADKALDDYHLAPSLRWQRTLCDPSGRLGALQEQVARAFFEPVHLRARRNRALGRVRTGLSGLDASDLPEDLALASLFSTGIMAHAVLSAAGENPTVRLRYQRAGEVLIKAGRADAHERLLQLAGFEDITREQAQHALALMVPAYDAASGMPNDYFFASDVSAVSRATAVDTAQDWINRGCPRETMFWTLSSHARAVKIIRASAPGQLGNYLPGFCQALALIGRERPAQVLAAARRNLDSLPWLTELTDELMAGCSSAADRPTP